MYTTIIPIGAWSLKRAGREKTVEVLRSVNVDRILLAISTVSRDDEKWRKNIDELSDNIAYMKSQGFEIGVWLWALKCSDAEPGEFTPMTGFANNKSNETYCPIDDKFLDLIAERIKDIARLNPSLILFDDDLRYGHQDIGLGCCCELHIKDIEKRLGEELPKENLAKLFFSGEPNKYRSAYLDSMGDAIRKFSRRMREAVDSVNPAVRLGTCACISTWDVDGADSIEVAKLLAGNTKPYLRLIGAPYWAPMHAWGNRLQDVIEFNRMELTWCAPYADEIEIVTEGDVFPRPRYACKAAYLENFDIAMHADGRPNGIMKYMFDYTSSQNYETGYVKRHIKNRDLYPKVTCAFTDKTATGVRVYEEQWKLRNYSFPEGFADTNAIQNMLFSKAVKFLANSSIPTTYDSTDVAGIAFGDNAKYLPAEAYGNGLILDLAAAKLLMKAGRDIGIKQIGGRIAPSLENYIAENEYIGCSDVAAFEIEPAEGATVQSYFICKGDKRYPAAITYENSAGERYLVFAFDMLLSGDTVYRNYMRQKQLVRCIEWLQRKKLPCVCTGNPELYIMCKKQGNEYAVGLWNLSEDLIDAPTVEMNGKITSASYINCTGEISGDKVVLDTLQPFAFAGFTVTIE